MRGGAKKLTENFQKKKYMFCREVNKLQKESLRKRNKGKGWYNGN